jgi:FMN phosphatase YigB (HAD superfamily)
MLDTQRIRAISLDLDDTLWPIWPTIERAEKVLHEWLVINAPMTAALFSSPEALRDIRAHMGQQRPDLKHDLSALRRESIRLALYRAGEDPLLAEPAFELFFAERQNVTFFPDVVPALEFLAARWVFGRTKCCTWATTCCWMCWAHATPACRQPGPTVSNRCGRTKRCRISSSQV